MLNSTKAACFPCATALASTWDLDLLRTVGETLGDECHAKGAHVLLAPTCKRSAPYQ
jgi:beta-glucosidase